MTEPSSTANGRTVTVRVPISIRRRGGRKLVLAPDGTNVTTAPVRRHIDNAMVKAIARAFRWREMLENGTHATIAEIAAAEKINESYVGRVLQLTLLAPDIVEAILGGRQPAEMTVVGLFRPFAVERGTDEFLLEKWSSLSDDSQPTEKMCEKQKFAPGFRIAWFRRPAIITSVRDNIRLINNAT